MKLFSKPSWLKPEIGDPKYWLHLVVIVFLIWFFANAFMTPLGIREIGTNGLWIGVMVLAMADIAAHSLLGLD